MKCQIINTFQKCKTVWGQPVKLVTIIQMKNIFWFKKMIFLYTFCTWNRPFSWKCSKLFKRRIAITWFTVIIRKLENWQFFRLLNFLKPKIKKINKKMIIWNWLFLFFYIFFSFLSLETPLKKQFLAISKDTSIEWALLTWGIVPYSSRCP